MTNAQTEARAIVEAGCQDAAERGWFTGTVNARACITEHVATALAAKNAELAEVHQRYVDANETRIDAEAQLEAALAKVEYQPGDHPVVPVKHDQFVKDVRRILSALTTEPADPEGWQEAGRIGDAVLDWMVKFDLLDAGNEYYVSDVLAVLNDLTPSTRPAEQAVTEAAIDKAVIEAIHALRLEQPGRAYDILKAAMEAGRHG